MFVRCALESKEKCPEDCVLHEPNLMTTLLVDAFTAKRKRGTDGLLAELTEDQQEAAVLELELAYEIRHAEYISQLEAAGVAQKCSRYRRLRSSLPRIGVRKLHFMLKQRQYSFY